MTKYIPDVETSKKELENSKDKKKDDGFVSRLVMKVVDNLQIFIDKIHIRYEDQSSHNVPFAFGITVEHLHAQSTDGDWRPTFLNVGQDIVHKAS
jgi:vacuolar protein sorting-associated protein 13A/C